MTINKNCRFTIDNDAICGEAYNEAIREVAEVLNEGLGTNLFSARDWARLETIALKLGIMFNENGEIVRG